MKSPSSTNLFQHGGAGALRCKPCLLLFVPLILLSLAAVAGAQQAADAVYGWGQNQYGQVGNGESGEGELLYVEVPARVVGPGGAGFLSEIVSIAAGGSHTIAAKATSGTVFAWGSNGIGQLGDDNGGAGEYSEVPVQTLAPAGEAGYLTGVVAVAAGWSHSVALKGDGTVWTWGGNLFGALGDGTSANSPRPVQVVAPDEEFPEREYLEDIVAIAAGGYCTNLALRADGTVFAWGRNDVGQLGQGDIGGHSHVPVKVHNIPTEPPLVIAVASSGQVSTALREDGTALAWGGSGCAGHFLSHYHPLPVPVAGPGGEGVMEDIAEIRPYGALKDDGTVWIWRYPTTIGTPGQAPGPWGQGFVTDAIGITQPYAIGHSGQAVTLVTRADGTVWRCYSLYPWSSALGLAPVRLLTNAFFVSPGDQHAAILTNGPLETFTLTALSDPAEATTIAVDPQQAEYEFGDEVSVEAELDPGWIWLGWTGDVWHFSDPDSLEITVVIEGDSTVTAHFEPGPTFEVATEDDLDWVYQNTPNILSNGGHKVALEVTVTDLAGNNSVSVSVSKKPDSGTGEVTVEDDPQEDPLLKYVYGSMRSDGTAGTGPLILEVTVTGDLAGEMTQEVSFTCHKLGDIDGNGGPAPGDLSLLINKLNGLGNGGFHDKAFDLDANGGAAPADVFLLINILNGQPVP